MNSYQFHQVESSILFPDILAQAIILFCFLHDLINLGTFLMMKVSRNSSIKIVSNKKAFMIVCYDRFEYNDLKQKLRNLFIKQISVNQKMRYNANNKPCLLIDSLLPNFTDLKVSKNVSPFYTNKQNLIFCNEFKTQLDKSIKLSMDEIVVTNERLTKQNQILKIEVLEKQNIIQQLKKQLDNSILHESQHKIENSRLFQQKLSIYLGQWKKQFQQRLAVDNKTIERLNSQIIRLNKQLIRYENISSLDQQNIQLRKQIDQLKYFYQNKLIQYQNINSRLNQQIYFLKQEFVMIVEQKQKIIYDLQSIIHYKSVSKNYEQQEQKQQQDRNQNYSEKMSKNQEKSIKSQSVFENENENEQQDSIRLSQMNKRTISQIRKNR